MITYTLTFFLLICTIQFAKSQENKPNEFIAVSTTQNPLKSQDLNESISKSEILEFRNDLQNIKKETIDEIEKRLQEIIKSQLAEIKNEFQNIKNELKKVEESVAKNINVIERANGNLTSLENCRNIPEDCKEIQEGRSFSGVYKILPKSALSEFSVYCDMDTKDGGWITILSRFDGSQDFYLNWTDYKQGFGKLSGEYWLGLQNLHEITSSKQYELLFKLVDWDSKTVYASYDDFKIGNESEDYKIISLGKYVGDAGDSFTQHKNTKFSTLDQDHDTHPNLNCAKHFRGAWWYHACYHVHLTGKFSNKPATSTFEYAIHWSLFHGYNYSLKEVKMMIRPARF